MSLASALARTHQSLPVAILEQCGEDDRVIVENIALVAQETLPALNLAQATITTEGSKYLLVVPCLSAATLRELRAIQTYNPARVHDIRLSGREGGVTVRIDICNGTAPLACTELEVVRLTKRSRWF